MTGLSCEQCGAPVTIEADLVGVPRYVHAAEAPDGHKAELPPVTMTYRHHGAWIEVSCPELGGDLGTVTGEDSARQLATGMLRKLKPARNVRETWLDD